jgi:hypothetical protein
MPSQSPYPSPNAQTPYVAPTEVNPLTERSAEPSTEPLASEYGNQYATPYGAQYASPYGSQYGRYSPPPYEVYGSPQYGAPQPPYQPQYGAPYAKTSVLPTYQGGVSYAPQGLIIPISLRTAIDTQVAKEGDYIQAAIQSNVSLGGCSYIPAGSTVTGQISESKAGRRLSRSGSLSILFNELRLPNGTEIPISAHMLGAVGKYQEGKDDEYHGETWKAKLGQTVLRGALGAGLLAGLGTGIGAIGGGGYGAGTGAWSGAAIGGGLGGLDMLLRKGRDVIIPSGTQMRLQLDEPISIPSGSTAT